MDTRICPRCNIEKPLTAYLPSHREGKRRACKDCRNEIHRLYKETPSGKIAIAKAREGIRERHYHAKYQREYSQKPEVVVRNLAKRKLRTNIDNGNIESKPCIVCGREAEAHHPDYNKPLEVIWLCSQHHRELHKSGTMPEVEQ